VPDEFLQKESKKITVITPEESTSLAKLTMVQ